MAKRTNTTIAQAIANLEAQGKFSREFLADKMNTKVRSMNRNAYVHIADTTICRSAGELYKFLRLPERAIKNVKEVVCFWGAKEYRFDPSNLSGAVELYCQC